MLGRRISGSFRHKKGPIRRNWTRVAFGLLRATGMGVMPVKTPLRKDTILVGADDAEKLWTLVEGERAPYSRDRLNLARLGEELDRATIVEQENLPEDVVRMGSRVRLMDLDSEAEMTYVLVYPHQAGAFPGAISVVAPVGTALLGYRQGAVIEWSVPRGVRRLKVLSVGPPATPARAA
jgi:regulator of nucleoside diphosphate kinase